MDKHPGGFERGKSLRQTLSLLVSQTPVLGIAAAWRINLLKNPIVAAGLGVVYEGFWLFWKGLGKPVWDEVWEGELKPQAVKALAEWVRVAAQNFFSGFCKRYRKQVIYDHRVFPVRGLLTPGQGALEVEKVFIELQIAPSHAMQVSANPITIKKLPGSQSIWAFLGRLKKKAATALAILGPPGCGKTTLLKHLALIFAAKKQGKYGLKIAIPVLVILREQATLIIEEASSLAEILQRYFADKRRYPELNPPAYWFARQLRTGRCLVLLDGLDEVVDAAHRQAISTWIDQQIRNYPRCCFLLTARPQGYRDNPIAQAQVLEVLSFTEEQVGRFIHSWYLANKLIAHGKDDRGVRQEAEREARDLIQRLGENPHLKALTVNPLLLTMIANVHNYRGALPDRRVNLYAEICDVFLGHWQRSKGVAEKLDAKQKRLVLQPLAEAMMTQKIRDLSTQKILALIRSPMLRVGIAEKDIPTFFEEAQQITCGLLIEKEASLWAFAHFTFQEYLCAAHWAQTSQAATWDKSRWQAFIADSWWHETLRLYAAQADADALVSACLALKTDAALQLAADIKQEALILSPSIRDNLSNALKTLVVMRLRSKPMAVSLGEAEKVFKIDKEWRPLEYIQNNYEDRGDVVFDHVTGLMWQKAGSDNRLTYETVKNYIKELNQKKFAGYDDWRLPTIPELMSLLESERKSNNFYINPLFDAKQRWCWSADQLSENEKSSSAAWFVYFLSGGVNWLFLSSNNYVRCVRS